MQRDSDCRWPGFFLTLEGPEGCGKTTQAERVCEHFRRAGVAVVRTCEPAGTPLGERLHALLIDDARPKLAPRAELLIYETARAQNVEEVVRPALQAGRLVVCDRFIDSSTAYQGYGLELPVEEVIQMNDLTVGAVRPDLTVVLDIDPALGLQRAGAEGKLDRIERRNAAFHERVRRGFAAIAAAEPERVAVLNGRRPRADVTCDIIEKVAERWHAPAAAREPG